MGIGASETAWVGQKHERCGSFVTTPYGLAAAGASAGAGNLPLQTVPGRQSIVIGSAVNL